MSSSGENPQKKDEKKARRVERVALEIEMEPINYARVKKVGESTTDLRFRDPEKAAENLHLKVEDDYVALPTPDRSKILLVRVPSVITRETIERNLGVSFLDPETLDRLVSAIEAARRDDMRKKIGAKKRIMRFKRRKRK